MLPGLVSRFSDSGLLWSDTVAALGRTLIPFLPEDSFDQQPLHDPHAGFSLVAQVRLDNRDQLAQELNLTPKQTLADSSLLAAAWERWGLECVDHLLGGFAFCVWESRSRTLFAVRDHAGEFPLFFYRCPAFVAVASSSRAIRLLPEVPRGFDEQRIADLLIDREPQRTTSFFEGIERLPGGHWLRCTESGIETRQYWHPRNARPTRFKRNSEYPEALTELLDRATLPRLRTAGQIAAQLSAGLDSSSVAASAALLLAQQGKTLSAYTSVPEPGFEHVPGFGPLTNEGPAAAEVAAIYPNMRHRMISTEDLGLMATLQQVNEHLDEPIINAINWLWIVKISDQARESGATSLLHGTAGNGTISYDTLRPLAGLFRSGRWISLARTVQRMRARGFTSLHGSAQEVLTGLYPEPLKRRFGAKAGQWDVDFVPINQHFSARYKLLQRAREMVVHPISDAEEQRLFYEYSDPAPSEAASVTISGVDRRDPTADKRILDFCFSIPPEQYIAEGFRRSLIRRAMQARLPASILTRTSIGMQGADWYLKVGRALPELREQLALISESPAVQRMLDVGRIAKLLDNFPTSNFHLDAVAQPINSGLLRGITIGMFLHSHDPQVRRPKEPRPASDPKK